MRVCYCGSQCKLVLFDARDGNSVFEIRPEVSGRSVISEVSYDFIKRNKTSAQLTPTYRTARLVNSWTRAYRVKPAFGLSNININPGNPATIMLL